MISRTVEAVLAPILALARPRHVFKVQGTGRGIGPLLVGVFILTALSNWPLAPYLRHAVGGGAFPGPEAVGLGRAVWLWLFVVTPLNTILYLLLVGGLVWLTMAPQERPEGNAYLPWASIALIASGPLALQRLFVAAILVMRGWTGVEPTSRPVYTGLDAVLAILNTQSKVAEAIAHHVELGDIGLVVLLSIGIATRTGWAKHRAAVRAVAVYTAAALLLVGVEMLLRAVAR